MPNCKRRNRVGRHRLQVSRKSTCRSDKVRFIKRGAMSRLMPSLTVSNFLIDFCGISLHILATNSAHSLQVREQLEQISGPDLSGDRTFPVNSLSRTANPTKESRRSYVTANAPLSSSLDNRPDTRRQHVPCPGWHAQDAHEGGR